ncbi:MAG: polymer-forming cytoskeletal protein [Nitrospinaceae bacterium]
MALLGNGFGIGYSGVVDSATTEINDSNPTENIKLSILTEAQYQFLVSKKPRGYYDNRTRVQLYSLIDTLADHKKYCTKKETRLHKRFQNAEFGILLPGNRKTNGPLKFKVSLCLDGEHEGDITTGGTLIINEKGSVQGNISAEEIICKGTMVGDISAGQKLTLHSTGTLMGDVVAPAVQIAKGAMFKGKCKLGNPELKASQKKEERVPFKYRIRKLFHVG